MARPARKPAPEVEAEKEAVAVDEPVREERREPPAARPGVSVVRLPNGTTIESY